MNRVKVGFFSISRHSESGDDRPYLGWHQLDHMPEQYQLPGLVGGQRWASTSSCRAARAAEADEWAAVAHVVCYLMGEPLDQTLDDFLDLGQKLADMGRFSHRLPSVYTGALRLLETHSAPAALVVPEVVPFRPNRGVYYVAEEPTGEEGWDDYLQRAHSETLPELLSVPGVAGAWIFGTTPAIAPRRNIMPGRYRMSLFYLDDDPAAVAERLAEPLRRSWKDAPTRPLLAAPFESMMIWDWDRFGPGAD